MDTRLVLMGVMASSIHCKSFEQKIITIRKRMRKSVLCSTYQRWQLFICFSLVTLPLRKLKSSKRCCGFFMIHLVSRIKFIRQVLRHWLMRTIPFSVTFLNLFLDNFFFGPKNGTILPKHPPTRVSRLEKIDWVFIIWVKGFVIFFMVH